MKEEKNTAFDTYLREITHSRERASEILDASGGDDEISRATLLLVWQLIFERLLRDDECEDLVRLSGIVQKLFGSTNQRKTHDLKMREEQRKEEEFQERKQKLQDSLQQAREENKGIPKEMLEQIERDLQLL